LNLFLQDYIGKTGTLLILILVWSFTLFLNLNSLRKNQSFFENTKEIKTDLGTNSGANTGGSYNLEEFAMDEKK
jgi:S-DNA-T family DNA segregation ATPase FtsK/SpoIIIE